MSDEQIQLLLMELKSLAAPHCLFCAHNTEEGVDACEEIDCDCDACSMLCPCRNCNHTNDHAGWSWHGFGSG